MLSKRTFSKRTSWELGPNALAAAIDARRAAGREVLDLTESNPTRCGLVQGGEALRASLAGLARSDAVLRYAPDPRGSLAAREAVAAHHARFGPAPDPASILLSAGTSEAYAHLFRLLADPGGRVLVPSPSYPLFGFLAALESVEIGAYPLRHRGGRWRVDLPALGAACAEPDVCAVVVVQPNNPTGSLLDAVEAEAVRALCRERRLALISDEVFADFRSPDAPAGAPATLLPAPGEEGPLCFVLGGASKSLALPQLKLSWMLVSGPEAEREEALARLDVISDTFLSVSTLAQAMLPELLAAQPEIAAPVRARIAASRARAGAVLATIPGATLLASDGGWSAIVRIGATEGAPAPDEDALVERLVEGPGVVVHPGWFFDVEPEDEEGRPAAHLVFSLLPEPDLVARGLASITAVLR